MLRAGEVRSRREHGGLPGQAIWRVGPACWSRAVGMAIREPQGGTAWCRVVRYRREASLPGADVDVPGGGGR
jgi:hypothetical protein